VPIFGSATPFQIFTISPILIFWVLGYEKVIFLREIVYRCHIECYSWVVARLMLSTINCFLEKSNSLACFAWPLPFHCNFTELFRRWIFNPLFTFFRKGFFLNLVFSENINVFNETYQFSILNSIICGSNSIRSMKMAIMKEDSQRLALNKL
jgi:hypothetical protein